MWVSGPTEAKQKDGLLLPLHLIACTLFQNFLHSSSSSLALFRAWHVVPCTSPVCIHPWACGHCYCPWSPHLPQLLRQGAKVSFPQKSLLQTLLPPLIGLACLLPTSLIRKPLWYPTTLPQLQPPSWRPRLPSPAGVVLDLQLHGLNNPHTHSSLRFTAHPQHIHR